jgi:hypothetical protein
MPLDRIGGVALLAPVLFCVAPRDVTNEPVLVRGPYWQSGSSTNVILRWRTDPPTDSLVRWGTDLNNLTEELTNTASTSEHEMALTGLVPATTYYYAVGDRSQPFAAGPEFRFTTSPTNARLAASGLLAMPARPTSIRNPSATPITRSPGRMIPTFG